MWRQLPRYPRFLILGPRQTLAMKVENKTGEEKKKFGGDFPVTGVKWNWDDQV